MAFTHTCNITTTQSEIWDKCIQQLEGFETDLRRLFSDLSKVIGKRKVLIVLSHEIAEVDVKMLTIVIHVNFKDTILMKDSCFHSPLKCSFIFCFLLLFFCGRKSYSN